MQITIFLILISLVFIFVPTFAFAPETFCGLEFLFAFYVLIRSFLKSKFEKKPMLVQFFSIFLLAVNFSVTKQILVLILKKNLFFDLNGKNSFFVVAGILFAFVFLIADFFIALKGLSGISEITHVLRWT